MSIMILGIAVITISKYELDTGATAPEDDPNKVQFVLMFYALLIAAFVGLLNTTRVV